MLQTISSLPITVSSHLTLISLAIWKEPTVIIPAGEAELTAEMNFPLLKIGQMYENGDEIIIGQVLY